MKKKNEASSWRSRRPPQHRLLQAIASLQRCGNQLLRCSPYLLFYFALDAGKNPSGRSKNKRRKGAREESQEEKNHLCGTKEEEAKQSSARRKAHASLLLLFAAQLILLKISAGCVSTLLFLKRIVGCSNLALLLKKRKEELAALLLN